MPYLKLQTNTRFDDCDASCIERTVLQEFSRLLSRLLDKPERYVMVVLEQGVPLIFSGNSEPALFMELKSIGLNEADAGLLSADLSDYASRLLAIPKERIYIEFTNAEGSMWGWNGRTF